jgi:hypothetical protein
MKGDLAVLRDEWLLRPVVLVICRNSRELCWSSIVPANVVNTVPLFCRNSPALSRSTA